MPPPYVMAPYKSLYYYYYYYYHCSRQDWVSSTTYSTVVSQLKLIIQPAMTLTCQRIQAVA